MNNVAESGRLEIQVGQSGADDGYAIFRLLTGKPFPRWRSGYIFVEENALDFPCPSAPEQLSTPGFLLRCTKFFEVTTGGKWVTQRVTCDTSFNKRLPYFGPGGAERAGMPLERPPR
ncbi:hypothetical protein [Azohydromonas aeria]|uniref:hypothetical protein n=1 Tax=Azohydromonas aeria TaxID=2590212 RepID=UPI0012FBC1D9|nr:hypothetical protein [Azohydromonas aeria]